MRKAKGSELVFIGKIKADGSCIEPVKESFEKIIQDDDFELHRLSITNDTWIAFRMSTFVVKLKQLKNYIMTTFQFISNFSLTL